ncbi:MAG TPA: hypothetical protein VNO50_03125 [Pyrinomonadaceae bacterium]|nr:hypothetical protein [Pyrinomonadaceae bacterium]
MIADTTFSIFVPNEVTDALRSIGEEFSEAERQDEVSERLGRNYVNALRAYEGALYECPYSPGANIIQPSAHDALMRDKMNQELIRVQAEGARMLTHFGGYLVLTLDEEDE